MKLVMTLLVRDEEDILAHNLAFHRAQGVDYFIIMDNLSVDATPGIAEGYVRRGLARYIHQEQDAYAQGEWVTAMARLAHVEHGADWVINNDADEFWYPARGDLRSTFAEVPPGHGVVQAERHNFVPIAEYDGTRPFYESMVWREAASLNPLGHPLPPKVAHRGSSSVLVAQGNHSVSGLGQAEVVTGLIEILHFPLRTRAQFENKIMKGGAAYERNTTLPRGMGLTWRKLREQQTSAGGLEPYFAERVHDAARRARELARGALVEDRRLCRFMQALGPTPAAAS